MAKRDRQRRYNARIQAFLDAKKERMNRLRRSGLLEDQNPQNPGHFYVAPDGSDSATGSTSSTAWASLAKLTAEDLPDGSTIHLKRGGHWRETLAVNKPNWTLAAYGSGAHPIIDASNRITGGSWVKEAGFTNIYRYTLVNADINDQLWINVWQDDQFMAKQASLAALDAAPGGYNFTITTGVGASVYIHATGSGNPASNGKTYDVAQRLFAVTANSTGFVMDGIETRRQIHNDGSFAGGGTLNNCRFIDGHKHNAFISPGSSVTNCHFEGSYYNGEPASYAVTFAVNAAGVPGVTYQDCQFVSRGDAIANPILSHAVTGLFTSFTMDGCTFTDFAGVGGFADVQTVTYRDCRLSDCGEGFVIGHATTGTTGNGLVEDCHFLGGGTRFISCFSPSGNTLTARRNKFSASGNTDGHIYSPGTASIIAEDNIFHQREFGFLIRSGGTVTASGNHFDTTTYAYHVPSYASLTSNNNRFLNGGIRVLSTADGDNWVEDYIAATGQESSSSWDADGRPALAFDYTAPTRFNLSTLSGLVACWDASYPAARPFGLSRALPSLGDRVLPGNALASAYAAPNQPNVAPGLPRSRIITDGGNAQRRFDAPTNIGDNLFSGGGMIFAVQSSPSSGGILAAKLNTTGWMLSGSFSNVMVFEGHADTDTRFQFAIPLDQIFLLDLEWDSDTPNVAPVVRVNGTAVTVTVTKADATIPADDSAATLCVGNRNWGSLATPWNGVIGEIVLLDQLPTTQQRADIRADMMQHWGIA